MRLAAWCAQPPGCTYRAPRVVGSVGGQLPQNIAMQLHTQGVNVLGTPPPMIDQAEDRHKFSGMLDDLGIDQPPWFELEDMQDKEAMRARCDELEDSSRGADDDDRREQRHEEPARRALETAWCRYCRYN